MLMRYPEGIWWIGLPLVFSAILVAFSAIRIYYFTQKENKLVNEQLSSLNTKPEEKQISRKSKF